MPGFHESHENVDLHVQWKFKRNCRKKIKMWRVFVLATLCEVDQPIVPFRPPDQVVPLCNLMRNLKKLVLPEC